MNRRMIRAIADAFFLPRPVLWIPVWGFGIFGYFRCRTVHDGFDVRLLWNAVDTRGFAGIFIFSLSVGVVYVINQIADIDVDRKNQGFALLAQGGISRSFAWTVSWMLMILACMSAYVLKPGLILFVIATMLIGVLYSFKPAHFSGRPMLDFLSNAFGYGCVAFGAGWYCAGGEVASKLFVWSAAPYFCLMCAGSISSTLPDYDGDRLCGKRTTAVVLGKTPAHALASACVVAALGLSLLVNDMAAGMCAILVAPLYCLYFVHRTPRVTESTYKLGGAICMICAAVMMPVFVPCAAVTLAATILYFRVRHHVVYPSLVPVTYEK